MNENGKNRREWVKTAAIIFLSVMLVLTFFSNTIMNYSLPEVATQYVQSGTITAKIRGTGTVESDDPYEVKVIQSRKVESVAVKVGDQVQKGDVLLYLADEESEELETARQELKAAEKELDSAWDGYYQGLLDANVTDSGVQAANGGVSMETYRQQLTQAQNAYKDAQNRVDEITEWKDAIGRQIDIDTNTDSSLGDETEAYEKAEEAFQAADSRKKQAEIALQAAQAKVSGLENNMQTVSDSDGDTSELNKQIQTAQAEVRNAENVLAEAEVELQRRTVARDEAKQTLENKRNKILGNLTSQSKYTENDLAAATEDANQKKKALDELTATLTGMFSLDGKKEAIDDAREKVEEAQEKVDKEVEKSIGATVTADIAGTVSEINIVAGNTTSADTPVMKLQPEGKGYTMSISVTNDQARRVSVGDRADLVNAWRYDDMEVTLAGIRPDPQDPGQKKLLTFNVSGSVVAGQTLNISVGQQSSNFDYIVPNSAIREDSNGKFILVVESKPTPLSTRYKAVRVDVEVIASDDTQSAINGAALYGGEFVITTSTQPVEPGQQVRLADN